MDSDGSSFSERFVRLMGSQVDIDPILFFFDWSFAWLVDSIACLTFWSKIKYRTSISWWLVASPLWCYYWLSIPLTLCLFFNREQLIERQIGSPPPNDAIEELYQYSRRKIEKLKHLFVRCASRLLQDFGSLASTILLINRLEQHGHVSSEGHSVKTIMMPLWFSWLCITLFSNFNTKNMILPGFIRDTILGFLTLVALKLDGELALPWRILFIIPWIAFSLIGLFAFTMLVLLTKHGVLRRPYDFSVPRGCTAIALSAFTHFFSFLTMSYQLNGTTMSLDLVFFPSMIAWIMMWVSCLFTSLALAERERELQSLLPQWDGDTTETTPSSLNLATLTDSQIASMAATMTEGKPTPNRLTRVGFMSFRRPTDNAEAIETASKDEILIEEGAVSHRRNISLCEDRNCFICFDAEGTSVLMECGHGLYCRPCANRLIVRRPHECPVCRQQISQIVDVGSTIAVGETIDIT